MTLYVRSGGSWVPKSLIYVRSGGVWVAKNSAFKRVGGVWVQFLTQLVTLTSRTISETYTLATAACYLRLGPTGQASEERTSTGTTNISGQWLNSGAASDYQAQCTQISGATITSDTGHALGTWYALGYGNIDWGLVNGAAGTTVTAVGKVDIRLASSGAVLASATITFNCTR